MSTPEPAETPALLQPEAGITQPVSTVKVGIGYQIALFLGQFGLFVALMAPVYVSMQLKAQALVGDDAANVIGSVLPIGALRCAHHEPPGGRAVRPHPHALGSSSPLDAQRCRRLRDRPRLDRVSPRRPPADARPGCSPSSPPTPCSPP